MSIRSEWKPLFEAVEDAGWRLRHAKHGFLAFPAAGLAPIALGGTPSDYRSVLNAAAALRRAGLNI
jgi:hypothetical protein